MNTQQTFSFTPKTDTFLNIRISRNTAIAIIISLLIHAIVLFFVLPQLIKPVGGAPAPQALTITLNQPQAKQVPQTIAEPEKPAPPAKKIPKKEKVTRSVMATQNAQSNNPIPLPIKTPEPPRPLDTTRPAPTEQATDMLDYVNKKRQPRQDEQSASAKSLGAPSEDQRDAVIKRNLAQEGGNGIFQVRDKNVFTAKLSFKGWKNNYNNARLEIFDVQAKGNETIELAIVRKMISIIRLEYTGDFQWESHRLGRAVTLSARLEDSAELEHFLVKEMFSSDGFR
jgi:hypothetical protein